jgi:hypothetical protein
MKSVSRKLLESNLKNDKQTKIKLSKTETAIISEVKPNIWNTRFSVDVEYFEKDKNYPYYFYSITESSKPGAIRSVINRLKEHHIVK